MGLPYILRARRFNVYVLWETSRLFNCQTTCILKILQPQYKKTFIVKLRNVVHEVLLGTER